MGDFDLGFHRTDCGGRMVNVVIFFEFVVDLPGDGSTYYYDDIEVAHSCGRIIGITSRL